MDPAHEWHPGTACLTPGWTIRVPVLPDEILSSWLTRAAFALGASPLSLTTDLWPGWRAWTLDVDRTLSEQRRVELSRASGIPLDGFEAATLLRIARAIADTDPLPHAAWPWILVLGSRNRQRTSGMQYCPICLATDKKPYFRLQWRFAWHVACEKHLTYLLDRCPHCGGAIQYHRLTFLEPTITCCPLCRGSLMEASRQPGSVTSDALLFQAEGDAHARGALRPPDDASLELCRDWFARADFFSLLARRILRVSTPALQSLGQLTGVMGGAKDIHDSGQLGIEWMRTADRARLFAGAYRLMRLSQDELVHALWQADVSQQAFCPKEARLPRSLEDVFTRLRSPVVRRERTKTKRQANEKWPPPRSRAQVERMWARLLSKMRKPPP